MAVPGACDVAAHEQEEGLERGGSPCLLLLLPAKHNIRPGAREAGRNLAYSLPLTRVSNAIGRICFLARTPQAGRAALALVGHVRVFNDRNGTAGGFLVQFCFLFFCFPDDAGTRKSRLDCA